MLLSSNAGPLLYISFAPGSVGHIYRVVNHAEAFSNLGFEVLIATPDQVKLILDSGQSFCALILFRPYNNLLFSSLRACADRQRIPLYLDIDDLTFDVNCFQPGEWSFWSSLSLVDQEFWRNRVQSQFQALQASDGAILSTSPLAQRVRSMHRPAWVWENGFGVDSWRSFQVARSCGPFYRRLTDDDPITIGYASGTPTHSADFAIAAVALGALMRRNFRLRLCVIGCLDLSFYPVLRGLEAQITLRPLVPYDQLANEYARFDINLAPLEEHSSFCQGKSALKFFEAAAVGVPTVATPTQPFRELIRHRWNGCLASTSDDWLLEHRRRRIRLAHAASLTTRLRCSPWAQRRDLGRILRQSKGR